MRNLYNIYITISESVFDSINHSSSLYSIDTLVGSSMNASIYYSIEDTFFGVAQFSFGDKILSQSEHLIQKLNKNLKINQ